MEPVGSSSPSVVTEDHRLRSEMSSRSDRNGQRDNSWVFFPFFYNEGQKTVHFHLPSFLFSYCLCRRRKPGPYVVGKRLGLKVNHCDSTGRGSSTNGGWGGASCLEQKSSQIPVLEYLGITSALGKLSVVFPRSCLLKFS